MSPSKSCVGPKVFPHCACLSILGDPGAVSRGRAKWRDESFQERAEEPLGTKSHRTISKRLCEYRLLIGQKKSLVLFCPIGEQQLSNHFRPFLKTFVAPLRPPPTDCPWVSEDAVSAPKRINEMVLFSRCPVFKPEHLKQQQQQQ